jgi:uroporphyrinogen-III decarboxylase
LISKCSNIAVANYQGRLGESGIYETIFSSQNLYLDIEIFMSNKQFEIFYWPTFKKLLLALIDAQLTPCPFFEGDCTSRLEYLLELPRGKIMGHFDRTDLRYAKKVIGNHMCIRGNVSVSILQTGSSADVKEYCKELIGVVGKNGGFIMSAGSAIDEAKSDNLKVLLDFTREYGMC